MARAAPAEKQVGNSGSQKKPAIAVLALRDTVHFPGPLNTVHVLREPSVRAIRRSLEADGFILITSQRDMSLENPSPADLHDVGTLAEVLQSIPMPDGGLRVTVRGIQRVRLTAIRLSEGVLWADHEVLVSVPALGAEGDALVRSCIRSFTNLVRLNHEIPPETLQGLAGIEDPGVVADTILHHLPIKVSEKQKFLEEADVARRLERTLEALKREEQILELDDHIRTRVEHELGDGQREYYLRQQLKVVQQELHERENRVGETEEYQEKILNARMPEEALVRAMAELRRLDRTPPASPEGMVVRNYLDTLIDLPWSNLTIDRIDVKAAAALLDRRHYGLGTVKDRILDHLAVRQLRGDGPSPILCFLGAPGVGKTSIVHSIAEAMGREVVRIALGGIRDEAEIRGHRRTYVGSMPGRIMNGLRDCGSRNPIVLLDEIDKIASDGSGDPTNALLEALDPEQNAHFIDHYVEAPFNLGSVMFIATANLVENIPAALRDRMELLPFPGYTDRERFEIGRRYLLPKALQDHGLQVGQLSLSDDALNCLVLDYTREAGVRNLKRQLAAVCRRAARAIAEGREELIALTAESLAQFLGRPRYRRSDHDLSGQIGVANCLVVGEHGGEVLPIEISLMTPAGEQPSMLLTGNLGEVMKESAYAALTYVRSNILDIAPGVSTRVDVHAHIAEGGIPKDGPSAGLTTAVALASAFSRRRVRGTFALTGEVTLRGRVIGVGGLREKVLAAVRAGLTDVVLPLENLPDLEDVPPEILAIMRLHPVSTIAEAIAVSME